MKRIPMMIAVFLLAVALPAAAQVRPRIVTPDAMGGGMMQPVVAADGTVLVTKVTQEADSIWHQDIVAITPAGTVAWSWRAPNVAHSITLADNLVIVSGWNMTTSMPMIGGSSELTALSLSNGTVAWKLTLDGVAMSLEPSANQIYAVVVKGRTRATGGGMGGGNMGGGGGMMNPPITSYMDRSLVAISKSGALLWTVPLGN